jgi:hypothetical protein
MTITNLKKIYVIYLVFGQSEMNSGIINLKNICSSIDSNAEITFLVVNNNLLDSINSSNDEIIKVFGNNNMFEFSGWDVGFDFIKKNFEVKDEDLILFANDTFHRRNYEDGGSSYLNFFSEKHLRLRDKDLKNIAIGYIDDFPNPVTLMGIEYVSWIRSNIFLLSYRVADMVYPLAFPLSKEYLFGNQNDSFFNPVQEISENWRAYIRCWLFGEIDPSYPEYRLNWIKVESLNEKNREYFKTKALTIMSEHYLSARLQKMRVEIVDTNLFPKRVNRHIANYYRI